MLVNLNFSQPVNSYMKIGDRIKAKFGKNKSSHRWLIVTAEEIGLEETKYALKVAPGQRKVDRMIKRLRLKT